MISRSLAALVLGLLVGSGLAWSVQRIRLHGSDFAASIPGTVAHETRAASAHGSAAPTVALVLPEPLAGAEADEALSAYLALPPLGKESPESEIQERMERMRALLTLLPDSHLEHLFSVLATRTGEAETRVRRAAFDIWCERAAPFAARWAVAIVPGEAISGPARSAYIKQAATAWARMDFAAAWAWLGSLADASLRKSLVGPLLSKLAATDPLQALALVSSGDEKLAQDARIAIFTTWSKKDPEAAIKALGATLLAESGSWEVKQALAQWVIKDPAGAVAWGASWNPTESDPYQSPLSYIGQALKDNPSALRPFADALFGRVDFPARVGVLGNVVKSWMSQDPKAATKWLQTLPEPALRSDLVLSALPRLETGNYEQFTDLIKLLPASTERDDRIARQLGYWAEADSDGTLAWLAKNPGPEFDAAARYIEGVFLAKLAATDPQAAIARLQTLPADSARVKNSLRIVDTWARTDSAAATRWFAEQISSGAYADPKAAGLHPYYITEIAGNWVQTDPAGFAEWTQTLPKGDLRDQAIDTLTRNPRLDRKTVAELPPRATYASQLAQIKDPELRDQALKTHLSRWIKADRQAAHDWIQSTDALAPQTAAYLLEISRASR